MSIMTMVQSLSAIVGLLSATLALVTGVQKLIKDMKGKKRHVVHPTQMIETEYNRLYELGLRYHRQGKYESALAAFHEAWKIDGSRESLKRLIQDAATKANARRELQAKPMGVRNKSNEIGSTSRNAPQVLSKSQKNPNIAFWLELVGGYLLVLGLGNFYARNRKRAVTLFVCWLVAINGILVAASSSSFTFIIYVAVPLVSAFILRKELRENVAFV